MASSKKPRASASFPPPARPSSAAVARQATAKALAENAARRERAAKGARAFNAAQLLEQAKAQGRYSVDLDAEIERHQAHEQQVTPAAGTKGKNPPPPLRDIFGSGRSGPFVPPPSQGEAHANPLKVSTGPLDVSILRRKT